MNRTAGEPARETERARASLFGPSFGSDRLPKRKRAKKPEPEKPAEPTVDFDGNYVPEWRRCPKCWAKRRGKGTSRANRRDGRWIIRYYRCNMLGCDHQWQYKVRLVVKQMRERVHKRMHRDDA